MNIEDYLRETIKNQRELIELIEKERNDYRDRWLAECRQVGRLQAMVPSIDVRTVIR